MTLNTLLLAALLLVIISLISQRKHLLMSLLCLEALILTMMPLLMFSWANTPQNSTPLFISILTLGACEASLGLALLVSMTRSTGSDHLNTLTLNKC